MRKNVNDWERALSIAAGVGLLAFTPTRRLMRSATTTAGLGLVARGMAGVCPVNSMLGRERRRDDTKQALGGARGIRIRERITVAKSAAELFDFWRDLRNLPQVMSHLERVDVIDDRRSHWIARGPAGMRVDWEAEIINEIPGELIGWKSLPGSDVASAGSVHFRQIGPAVTEVEIVLQYDPPVGRFGASVAWLTGQGPARMLRADLARLKDLMENGGPDGRAVTEAERLTWLVVMP